MIELRIDHDYLVGDTDEWIEDRTDGICEPAQRALGHATDNGLTILEWLGKIGATGLYGEAVCTVHTYNEDNFLSHDLAITLAHTERFGSLLIVDRADAYGPYGSPTVYVFNGDDDADAYGYTSGYAVCSVEHACHAELILESGGCYVWQNGGGLHVRTDSLIVRGEFETHATCPMCHIGTLTFLGD